MAFDWSSAKLVSALQETVEDVKTTVSGIPVVGDIIPKEQAPSASPATNTGSQMPSSVPIGEGEQTMPSAPEKQRVTSRQQFLSNQMPGETPQEARMREIERDDQHVYDIISEVIGEEGGYVNNPRDTGGPTKYGIALNFNKDVLEEVGVDATEEGVKNMTQEQAVEIYRRKYWEGSRASELPEEAQFDYFTAYINSPRRAVKALQTATGAKADGIFGPRTAASVKKWIEDNPDQNLGRAMKREYVFSLAGTGDWDAFGNGWANRYLETSAFGKGKGRINLNNMTRKEALDAMQEEYDRMVAQSTPKESEGENNTIASIESSLKNNRS